MFASTPQSIRLAAYFQLPGRGAFWCVQPPPKSCPRLREKWTRTYVSGRKGSDSKMPSCLTVPPQLRLRSAAPPFHGGAFWGTLCAKIYELTLWLEQGRLTHCRSQFSLFLPVLRFAYSSTGRAQLRTSRSDRFNGVTGVARGPKGRNRNLPWPPGKKVYKIICSVFVCFTPSVKPSVCQLPLRGSLLVRYLNSYVKPPSLREVDFAKQKTEGVHRGCSCLSQPLSRLAATAPRPGSLLV